MSEIEKCQNCGGTGWVCEAHENKPWAGISKRKDACRCSAGMQCEECGGTGGNQEKEPPTWNQ